MKKGIEDEGLNLVLRKEYLKLKFGINIKHKIKIYIY